MWGREDWLSFFPPADSGSRGLGQIIRHPSAWAQGLVGENVDDLLPIFLSLFSSWHYNLGVMIIMYVEVWDLFSLSYCFLSKLPELLSCLPACLKPELLLPVMKLLLEFEVVIFVCCIPMPRSLVSPHLLVRLPCAMWSSQDWFPLLS